mmetsp:Transcript_5609/g.8603  ORF Transcript_5609/g.8603 Transcript_5609/m.8603 type:complete len:295 (+) Transcript_5609:969-1853(+)
MRCNTSVGRMATLSWLAAAAVVIVVVVAGICYKGFPHLFKNFLVCSTCQLFTTTSCAALNFPFNLHSDHDEESFNNESRLLFPSGDLLWIYVLKPFCNSCCCSTFLLECLSSEISSCSTLRNNNLHKSNQNICSSNVCSPLGLNHGCCTIGTDRIHMPHSPSSSDYTLNSHNITNCKDVIRVAHESSPDCLNPSGCVFFLCLAAFHITTVTSSNQTSSSVFEESKAHNVATEMPCQHICGPYLLLEYTSLVVSVCTSQNSCRVILGVGEQLCTLECAPDFTFCSCLHKIHVLSV